MRHRRRADKVQQASSLDQHQRPVSRRGAAQVGATVGALDSRIHGSGYLRAPLEKLYSKRKD
jgi:hypothetical protein